MNGIVVSIIRKDFSSHCRRNISEYVQTLDQVSHCSASVLESITQMVGMFQILS